MAMRRTAYTLLPRGLDAAFTLHRGLLEFLYNYTLGGMVFQCSSLDVGKPWLTILNAAATGALATALGARLFHKKEIN